MLLRHFWIVSGFFFAETLDAHIRKPALSIKEEDGCRRLALGFLVGFDGEDQWVYPIPPLNFVVTSDSGRLSFKRQMEFFAEHRGVKSINTHIKTQANLRNKLLYAGPEGYPGSVELSSEFFEIRTTRVMALVRAYLLLQPYREPSTFVQNSLDAFLAMLGELKEHDLSESV